MCRPTSRPAPATAIAYRAPEWTGTFGLENRFNPPAFGAGGQIVSAIDLQYVGSRAADIRNSFDLKSYTTINARLGWQRNDLSIYAYGRNLRDKRPEKAGTEVAGVQALSLGRGRTVGVGLTAQF
nr:TonB-dependent receptor [Alkalilimnicola ehrlichii]